MTDGSAFAIDTISNRMAAHVGVLPAANATYLRGTFRGNGSKGLAQATTLSIDERFRDARCVPSKSANAQQLGANSRQSLITDS